MRLTVFNGSPRTRTSNTGLLLDHLLAGFTANGGEVDGHHYLAQPARRRRQVEAFAAAETALIAFPLYVDAMPAPVKEFIEALAPLAGRADNPGLLFLVQSGFPEACHSRPVEAWLERFARRMNAPYLGTIVKGGAEGIRERPAAMQKNIYRPFHDLGVALARTAALDPRLLAAIAGRERYAPLALKVLAPLMMRLGIGWWDRQLRENGAYERRDAAPYSM